MYPSDLKYTKDHEWVKISGADADGRHHRLRAEAARRRRVSRAARSGTDASARATSFGTIESVKAVSELYSPVDRRGDRGEQSLRREVPNRSTSDPHGSWMIAMKVTGGDGRPARRVQVLGSDAVESGRSSWSVARRSKGELGQRALELRATDHEPRQIRRMTNQNPDVISDPAHRPESGRASTRCCAPSASRRSMH